MLYDYPNTKHTTVSSEPQGTVFIVENNTVSLDDVVSHIIQCSRIFPGTLQKDAAVVPYLTVKENFDLFVSKARPKERKVDLLVDDAFSEMDLQESDTRCSFDSLPPVLSLRLQWVLNQLCKKKVVVADRWLWEISAEERSQWFELFHSSIVDTDVMIFILASSDSPKTGDIRTIHRQTDITKLFKKSGSNPL